MKELSVDNLLNDEFVEFSKKISDIHNQLKEKSDAVKKVVDSYKKEKELLENTAKSLLAEWNTKATKN